jgi:nitrate/TMAO reductase-like tetraheme cytochrome c subunit
MCHGDPAAKGESGKSIGLDAKKFGASVHGEMQLPCTACHADVSADKIPHGKIKPVDCSGCHDKPAKEYADTVHGKARAEGKTVAATCANCHGTHDILRSKDPASRTNHLNLESTCGACHGNEQMVKAANLPGGNVQAKYHDSIHGRDLRDVKKGLQQSVPVCTDCHGAHSILPKSDEKSRTSRARIPDTCGACHAQARSAFGKSQHGKLRQDNNLSSPGCSDCHSAHSIQQHNLPKWQLEVIGTCGNCHQDYVTSFRDTFHGQVTSLGYANMATCDSCHGAHQVLPASNPASMVSKENRVKTCQRCHANANENFAAFDPHANRHDKARSPLLYYVGKFMDYLLLGVFAFFGLHTILWLYRSLRVVSDRRKGRSDANNEEKG